MMKSTMIALAAAGLLASTGAVAQSYYYYDTPRHYVVPPRYSYDAPTYHDWQARADDRSSMINDREARIDARIQRGLANGRITDREARWLHRELRDIEAKERSYMSDGFLSRTEFNELSGDLDRLAENVRRQARDEDRAY
jgi:hypothetical protein